MLEGVDDDERKGKKRSQRSTRFKSARFLGFQFPVFPGSPHCIALAFWWISVLVQGRRQDSLFFVLFCSMYHHRKRGRTGKLK